MGRGRGSEGDGEGEERDMGKGKGRRRGMERGGEGMIIKAFFPLSLILFSLSFPSPSLRNQCTMFWLGVP